MSLGATGLSATASASRGQGQGAGEGTGQSNTQVSGQAVQIQSGGNTTLTGGAITSSQGAVDSHKNTFTTAGQTAAQAQQSGALALNDVNNSASFEARGVSVGVNIGTQPGKESASLSSVGVGSTAGQASSTTVAAISGLAGNAAARTGDVQTGIKPIFEVDKVKKEIEAQVAITQEAGRRLPKAIGDEMDKRRDMLKQEAQKAQDQGESTRAAALRAEAGRFDEGGSYRIAAHTAVGALSGGAGGALGAGAGSAAAPALGDIQSQLETALQSAGMSAQTSRQVASLSAGALAATLGGAAGGAAGAATAFNVDMNNRQLHPDERRKAGELAKKSGGKYTQEEIENALRNAGNTDKGESIVAGMVVDPKARNAIYDKGAVWTMGENGQLVQVLPSQPPADLVAYIKANTGDTYSWYAPGVSAKANANGPRDRLTNLPLDDKGRYERTVVLDGKAYEPKFHSCATAECVAGGKNLDMSDPGTQAYVRALDQQIFKDIGTGATAGSLVSPVGVGARVLMVLGLAASVGQTATSDTPIQTASDELMKAASDKGAEAFFRDVLGQTPGAAARASALISLSGGWDAFLSRVKTTVFGMKPDDTEK